MATNVATDALPKPGMTFCKKCSSEHEKPVGNKCERSKQAAKDMEKRDSSRESLPVKKTPKGKVGESQDKMLDLVLNTMTNVTEKLSAMDDRITGLASRIDATPAKAATRKSRPREQSKRRGVTEVEEALFASPTGAPLIQEGGTSYAHVFPDTAVAVKTISTPARPKKQKHALDLGLTPLNYQPAVTTQVTSTITAPTQGNFATGTCTQTSVTTEMEPQEGSTQQSVNATLVTEEVAVQDHNQNVVYGHVDQFGNLVRVQGPIDSTESRDIFVPATERHAVNNPVNPPTLDTLRSNPLIQQLVEERMAALEAKMKLEIQGGMQRRRKSGRYNVADTPHITPHLRWPNETCVIGTARKRVTFDELSLGQFVIGFINNVMDTQHVPTMKHMLTELVETVKLAENISWPIARGAFAASMLKIEDESIAWSDTRTLADQRLTYSQSAVFAGSTTMSPRGPPAAGNGTIKKIACKWYNEGTCPHSADHLDTSGTTLFKHVCLYCFKTLKRSNAHVEGDCLNRKKVIP